MSFYYGVLFTELTLTIVLSLFSVFFIALRRNIGKSFTLKVLFVIQLSDAIWALMIIIQSSLHYFYSIDPCRYTGVFSFSFTVNSVLYTTLLIYSWELQLEDLQISRQYYLDLVYKFLFLLPLILAIYPAITNNYTFAPPLKGINCWVYSSQPFVPIVLAYNIIYAFIIFLCISLNLFFINTTITHFSKSTDAIRFLLPYPIIQIFTYTLMCISDILDIPNIKYPIWFSELAFFLYAFNGGLNFLNFFFHWRTAQNKKLQDKFQLSEFTLEEDNDEVLMSAYVS